MVARVIKQRVRRAKRRFRPGEDDNGNTTSGLYRGAPFADASITPHGLAGQQVIDLRDVRPKPRLFEDARRLPF